MDMLQLLSGSKACFKCGETKPLTEFYAHPKMRDGHLNKCILCARGDAYQREFLLRQTNPDWVRKERERCRLKIARYRSNGHGSGAKPEHRQKWIERNGHKVKAQRIAANAFKKGLIAKPSECQWCGVAPKRLEKHHPDYSKPLEIVWLCPACHGKTKRKP